MARSNYDSKQAARELRINEIRRLEFTFENFVFISHTERFTDLGQAKICEGGSALGKSRFFLLPQLPQKTMIDSKVVKIDLKNNHLALLI